MLNKRDNKFWFNFPKGFLFPGVEEQFKDVVKGMPMSFADGLSYLNSTIQGVSLPGIQLETSEQILNREPINWKQGVGIHRRIEKEITVTFRATEGLLNWFMLLMNAEEMSMSEKNFYPDFTMRVLNNKNYQLFAVQFVQPQLTALDAGDFSFTSNSFDTKTFTVTFKYNRFMLKFDRD